MWGIGSGIAVTKCVGNRAREIGYQAACLCVLLGEEIVRIIESTPLDDASDFEIDSDFMPILKEVRRKPGRCLRFCYAFFTVHPRAHQKSITSHEGLPSFLPAFTPHCGDPHPTHSLRRLPLSKVPNPLNN